MGEVVVSRQVVNMLKGYFSWADRVRSRYATCWNEIIINKVHISPSEAYIKFNYYLLPSPDSIKTLWTTGLSLRSSGNRLSNAQNNQGVILVLYLVSFIL